MPEAGDLSALKPREVEVVMLVAAGLDNKEVAIELGISPRTVEVHRLAAIKELRLRNSAELVLYVLTGQRSPDALRRTRRFVRRGRQGVGGFSRTGKTLEQYRVHYFRRKHGLSLPDARAILRPPETAGRRPTS
jgi:DNA-binding CsgD family transcriptional regulator